MGAGGTHPGASYLEYSTILRSSEVAPTALVLVEASCGFFQRRISRPVLLCKVVTNPNWSTANMFRGPGLLFSGCLLVLLATAVTGQITVQSYLESDHVRHPSAGGSALPGGDGPAKGISDRRWDTLANEESTSNLIFESVGSLLQTWGNTRRRNGE